MIDKLKKVYKWKTITKNRIDLLIEVYDYFIKGDESLSYKSCKCDSSLRIMMLDIKKYCVENNI
jgi:hypothetical protein